VRKVETLKEWVAPIGSVPVSPCAGPGYMFSDSSFRSQPAETFQTTHIKTYTYEARADDEYEVTLDDFNVLTGKTTRTVTLVQGQMPLAPTVKSSLTSLILQAFAGGYTDPCVANAFAGKQESLNVSWAENQADVNRAAHRAMQRATAIVRTIKGPADPNIRIGQTVRLIQPVRHIDACHMVVGRQFTVNPEGGAMQELELEEWMR
jgi:hypothetical protein